MSNHEDDGPAGTGIPGMEPLEAAIDRVVAAVRAGRRQARVAEERAEGSDELLRQFGDGSQDPGALSRRVAELEAENDMLRSRIQQGREGVDQIMTSIRFLEDGR